MANEAGISLGSNLGDRLSHLRAARDALAAFPDTKIVAQSSVYETEPVGVKPEYQHLLFLNAVVILETELSCAELFRRLKNVELQLGRQRLEDRYAPRVIDIDLIYYGQDVISHTDLTIPHPHWRDRRFVVEPLSEVRPHLRLPGESLTIRLLLSQLPVFPTVKLLTRNW